MPVSYDSTARNGSAETGLTVRTCKERSLAMMILQMLIKPVRPSLIKPGPPQPPGSPRLSLPGKVHRQCQVGERQVNDIWLYDLSCRKGKQKHGMDGKSGGDQEQQESHTKRHIYYFAGGSWQDPPSGNHWSFVTELARRLPGTIVTIVSSPLAPNSPASITLPQLRTLYDTLMQESSNKGERAILVGDSSGGNLALSLTTWSASGGGRGIVPAGVMAICPTTDLRHAEPQIHAVAKKDPVLTLATINSSARTWYRSNSKPEAAHLGTPTAGGPLTTADDPAISPVLAPLEPLAAKHVKIHGVTGSYDILAPEAVSFREKCREAGVTGEWLDWDKQMHCFPLAFGYGLRESVQGMAWIVDVLERT